MTIIMHLGALQAERLAFSYSPLHETVRSLRVLNRSQQHPLHLPWVLRMRQQMPPALKAEASAFSIIFAATIPDIFAGPLRLTEAFPTFEEEFRVTQDLPPAEYAELVLTQTIMRRYEGEGEYTFARVSQSQELRQHVLARTQELCPSSLAMVEELLTDPEQSHKRFLRFFSWYWETCIALERPQLEEQLLRDIQQRGQILFEQGPFEVLDSLAPQLNVSWQEENITMRYPSQRHEEMRIGEQLFLVPSAYVWPRLHIMFEEDMLVALVYSIQQFQEEGSAPVPPERLLKLLRAAGDMTRLQILQLLSQRPRSTREIAGILNLTEAGISKHLKLLQDAGFVRPERSSYYVLYQSQREPLAEITRGLDRLL
ncbi:ArsR family transcriptional regulator [Ktedonobacter sp. SOSP1-52]|uniref:ArsR/SmtB family transcription factor n=1 Tax=Ktedonobacter sp. SOSP1-52 TaxID=2778366 RepID=UPI0019153E52|nr:DUF5937 family protein [Ktedonobacter sp. SOSP1-52]GHO68170.1 ArsR family transcriptional regulator [Ktedonobacter sp. SOSP1-52]